MDDVLTQIYFERFCSRLYELFLEEKKEKEKQYDRKN